MAEAIICDVCGTTCKPSNATHVRLHSATHVRLHRLSMATQYNTAPFKYADMCTECYKKLMKFLGGDKDVITEHHEATTECEGCKHCKSGRE